ncbi:MAG: D-fructose-6-phosphate amidotransferase, partial [Steroidobacteraceae bacterium]
MVLFGNAHSHALVKGTALTPDQIKNDAGTTLYPAYFMTRLTVPALAPLSSYKLWEQVCVGVDVRRFGDTLLESKYALGRGRQLPGDPQDWDADRFPMMEGNNLLVIDSEDDTSTKRKVGNPGVGLIANLPKSVRAPKGIMLSKQARTG